VSGPHANACAGAACCALAVGPAAAGACLVLMLLLAGAACCDLAVGPAAAGACLVLMLMLVLALLVALWLLGLQLVVTSRSWRLIKFFMYWVWIKGGLMANDWGVFLVRIDNRLP
jgi:hypothetical protein